MLGKSPCGIESDPGKRKAGHCTPIIMMVDTRSTRAKDAAAGLGHIGSIAAGATVGATLAGPAAPLGALVGGFVGALTTAEPIGRSGVRTSLELCHGLAARPASTVATGGSTPLDEVRRRTGCSVEESTYYLDEAGGVAELAIASYEAEEAALREAALRDPTLASRLQSTMC
jgi:hypothetical protein